MKPVVRKLAGCILLAVTLGLAIAGTRDEFWLTVWSLALVFLAVPLMLLSVRDLIAAFSRASGPGSRFWLMLHLCAVFAAAIGYSLAALVEPSARSQTRWLIVVLPALVYLTPLLLWLHGLPVRFLQYLWHALWYAIRARR